MNLCSFVPATFFRRVAFFLGVKLFEVPCEEGGGKSMIIHVALYRMVETLNGERKMKKRIIPYRMASKIKWFCLRHI